MKPSTQGCLSRVNVATLVVAAVALVVAAVLQRLGYSNQSIVVLLMFVACGAAVAIDLIVRSRFHEREPRYCYHMLVFIGGIILTVGASIIFMKLEYNKTVEYFNNKAISRIYVIESTLKRQLFLGRAMQSLSAHVMHPEYFDGFMKNILQDGDDGFVVGVCSLVAKREDFELSAGLDITDWNSDGSLENAPDRSMYCPLVYRNPSLPGLIGVDVLSSSFIGGAVRQALEKNIPVTTIVTNPHPNAYEGALAVTVQPVVSYRSRDTTGFILLGFSPEEMVERSLARLPAEEMDIRLGLRQPDGSWREIYRHAGPTTPKSWLPGNPFLPRNGRFRMSRVVSSTFATWKITAQASPAFFETHRFYGTWAVLFVGLLMSILATLWIKQLDQRRAFMEHLVWDMVGMMLEKEAHLDGLLYSSTDGICALDDHGRFSMHNERFLELWGIDETLVEPGREAELVEYLCSRLENPDELRSFIERSPGSGDIETRSLKLEDGRVFELLDISVQRFGANEGRIFVFRDVTEREEAEEAKRRLIQAIEQSSETVVITDSAGAILYVNPAFEKLTGYTREEALGQNPRILKSGQHDQAFYRDMWNTVSSGQTWRGRFINKSKDGELFIEDATISPIRDKSGRIVNYVAVKRDVTKEVKLEELLRQSQKMEAVGQLAGGIAHDFNNILQAILGYTELILEDPSLWQPHREDLERIRFAATRATKLVGQLLAFSRKQVLRPLSVDINRLVGDFTDMLRRLIGEHIELVIDLGEGVPVVEVDPVQLEQVLVNLCINARDAMPDGGTITISTRVETPPEEFCVEHSLSRGGRYVVLSVTDTGTGMEPPTVEKIFDPFFTTKETGKGTGLGLAMVYGTIRQHGGDIMVHSEPGRGTRFDIYLPEGDVETSGHTPKPEDSTATAKGDGETILVAEDDPAILELAVRVLTDAGYRVLTASDGEEAMEAYLESEGRVDLVILDLVMPKLTGWQVYRKLQEMGNPNVMFTSGYDREAGAANDPGTKGVPILRKPYDLDALLGLVERCLHRDDGS